MGWSLKAHTIYTGGGGSGGGTSPSMNTTGADIIILNLSAYNSASGITVSDSKSCTWHPLMSQSNNLGTGEYNQIFYASQGADSGTFAVGAGHTFTASGSNMYCSFEIAAYSGSDTTADPLDKQTGSGQSVYGSVTDGPITPTNNGALIVHGTCDDSGASADTFAASDGTTITQTDCQVIAAGILGGVFGWGVQTTAAAISSTATQNNGPSVYHAASTIASFNPTAVAPDTLLGQAVL